MSIVTYSFRFLTCLALICAVALPQAVRARAKDTENPALLALLAKLRAVEAVSAHFREEKRIALLATPLISEGDVYYEKSRSLVRHTRKPAASSLLLEGDKLSFGNKKGVESATITAQPSLSVLVDAFIGVLSGDKAALERAAKLTLETGPGEAWRMVATPTRDPLLKLVRVMEFEGVGARLLRMRMVDANGDETLTTFSEVTLRKPFEAAERARLFRIGG